MTLVAVFMCETLQTRAFREFITPFWAGICVIILKIMCHVIEMFSAFIADSFMDYTKQYKN